MTNEIAVKAQSMPQKAQALEVFDTSTYQHATTFLQATKAVQKEIDATFDPIISKANAAHKEAVAQKKKVETPLKEAESIIKRKMVDYQTEEERKRREKEYQIREEARKKAETERLEQAQKAEQSGNHKKAEELINKPIVTAPVVLESTVPKAAGISTRTVWKFRIIDPDKVTRGFMNPDEVRIGQSVRSMGKMAESVVGGIEVYQETVMSARVGVSQ